MFESLAESLEGVFRKLSGKGRLSEKNVQEGLREVRMALLAADVHFKVAKDFIDRVTAKAIGQDVLRSVSPTQMIVKVVYDELVALMGPVDHAFPTPESGPLILMMVGLQGCGKTTTTGKLAAMLKRQNRKPIMVAADLIRPAAIEQLKVLGKQIDVPVYAEDPGGRAVKVCARGLKKAEELGRDVVILDTQGRLHIDKEMMDELVDIKEALKPHQILLVADAMTGQDAVNSAEQFHKTLAIDGVILTKLDGDARGGAAMSVKAVTGRPIKFVGMGEKIENLEPFHPDRVASRILGMGDVVSLVEKAQQAVDVDQARKIQEKIRKDDLSLQDFLEQFESMKKMGPIKDLMKMIPGANQFIDKVDEDEMKHMQALIQSMTREERENPEIIDASRKRRISRGAGRPVHEVNSLLKQFDEARRMIRMMKKGKAGLGDLMRGMK